MMIVNNKYNLGEIVYLVTDPEQIKRIVTMIKITNGDILYQISCGVSYSDHYDFELSEVEDLVTKVM